MTARDFEKGGKGFGKWVWCGWMSRVLWFREKKGTNFIFEDAGDELITINESELKNLKAR